MVIKLHHVEGRGCEFESTICILSLSLFSDDPLIPLLRFFSLFSFLPGFFISSFLQPRVIVLLRRCLFDNDDEVRGRGGEGEGGRGAMESPESDSNRIRVCWSSEGSDRS